MSKELDEEVNLTLNVHITKIIAIIKRAKGIFASVYGIDCGDGVIDVYLTTNSSNCIECFLKLKVHLIHGTT